MSLSDTSYRLWLRAEVKDNQSAHEDSDPLRGRFFHAFKFVLSDSNSLHALADEGFLPGRLRACYPGEALEPLPASLTAWRRKPRWFNALEPASYRTVFLRQHFFAPATGRQL